MGICSLLSCCGHWLIYLSILLFNDVYSICQIVLPQFLWAYDNHIYNSGGCKYLACNSNQFPLLKKVKTIISGQIIFFCLGKGFYVSLKKKLWPGAPSSSVIAPPTGNQWISPGSGGSRIFPRKIIFQISNFFQKLHENERIWTRGARVPGTSP